MLLAGVRGIGATLQLYNMPAATATQPLAAAASRVAVKALDVREPSRTSARSERAR